MSAPKKTDGIGNFDGEPAHQSAFSSTLDICQTPKKRPRAIEVTDASIGRFPICLLLQPDALRCGPGPRSIALRYFDAAGADGEIGEDHDPETHILPLAIDAAPGRRPNVTIFGTDYETPAGTCARDNIHVTDLADAYVKVLEAFEERSPSGITISAKHWGSRCSKSSRAVKRVTGLRVPVKRGDRRAGDLAALVSDATKAREAVGWQARIAGLDDIVGTAWAWRHEVLGSTRPKVRTAGA